MSSERDQPTIDSYGGPQPVADWSEPENECRNCGADIDSQTARLVGDNDGCVKGCVDCREQVLDEHQVARDEYTNTLRLALYLRKQDQRGESL